MAVKTTKKTWIEIRFHLPLAVVEQLDRWCDHYGLSRSGAVRLFLTLFLDRAEADPAWEMAFMEMARERFDNQLRGVVTDGE